MKKLAAIVVILLCLYICACGNAEAPPEPADANVLPEYAYPFCYASLGDFKKSISKEKELYAELSEKGAKKETIDDFGVFVEKYKSQNFIVPYINGKAIELRNEEGYAGISVFPSEAYGLPWVFFYPKTNAGENFYIKMAYLPDEIIKAPNAPTASEVIKMISPDSPNINNPGKQHEKIYDRVIELEDRNVTAMVIEYKADNRSSASFVYGDLLVEIKSNPDVWNAEWFSSLSFSGLQ